MAGFKKIPGYEGHYSDCSKDETLFPKDLGPESQVYPWPDCGKEAEEALRRFEAAQTDIVLTREYGYGVRTIFMAGWDAAILFLTKGKFNSMRQTV